MGSGPRGVEDIKDHVFFYDIEWDLVAEKQITPPYKPEVQSEGDVGNIDKIFTKEKPAETIEDSLLL